MSPNEIKLSQDEKFNQFKGELLQRTRNSYASKIEGTKKHTSMQKLQN